MTFYDGQEDNYEILKSYFCTTDTIKINYLFRDKTIKMNYSKEKELEISKLMIEQALARDEELYEKLYKESKEYFTQTLLTLIPLMMSFVGEVQLLFCLSFILGIIASKNLTESYDKFKELKKFRLYYSMKEELEKEENKNITKIIEFESQYREPIHIGTLNEFSYSDVKKIKKELKRRNNINSQEKMIKQ